MSNLDLELIGKRIALKRIEKNYTQQEVGDKIGVGYRHISNIERGNSNFSLELLLSLCDVLDTTPNYILLGSLHPNDKTKNIVDSLSLCSENDIPTITGIVEVFVSKANK